MSCWREKRCFVFSPPYTTHLSIIFQKTSGAPPFTIFTQIRRASIKMFLTTKAKQNGVTPMMTILKSFPPPYREYWYPLYCFSNQKDKEVRIQLAQVLLNFFLKTLCLWRNIRRAKKRIKGDKKKRRGLISRSSFKKHPSSEEVISLIWHQFL